MSRLMSDLSPETYVLTPDTLGRAVKAQQIAGFSASRGRQARRRVRHPSVISPASVRPPSYVGSVLNADDETPNVALTLAQLRKVVELAEEIEATNDAHTYAKVFEVGGLRALKQAVIVQINSFGPDGHSGYTEAVISKAGDVLVGYEPPTEQS
jgi:hypothetical protein